MTETATRSAPSRLADAVKRLAAEDPIWLAEERGRAIAAFAAAPLPPRSEHLWRYTDPAKILPGDLPVGVPDGEFDEMPEEFRDTPFATTSAYAVARDGVVLRSAVDPERAAAGVILEDLRTACGERGDLVQGLLGSLADTCDGSGGKFDHLSRALFPGGVLGVVPAGVVLERPLKIAHRVGGNDLVACRSLLVAERGADATFVIDLSSSDPDSRAMIHEGVEAFVGAGARLRIVYVQTLGRKVVHAPVIRARVERDAMLETVFVTLGGKLVKSLLTAELAGPGANTRTLGIVFGDGRQHLDHHTFQDHVAPHTTSDLDYRVVCGGRARSAYTGRLRIGVGGTGVDANQANHNLLLSKKARADTIPELEILTDDVKCAHAATVGPIDEEQIYFCAGRGIDPEAAKRLVVTGFLEPTVSRIPPGDILDRARAALAERLS